MPKVAGRARDKSAAPKGKSGGATYSASPLERAEMLLRHNTIAQSALLVAVTLAVLAAAWQHETVLRWCGMGLVVGLPVSLLLGWVGLGNPGWLTRRWYRWTGVALLGALAWAWMGFYIGPGVMQEASLGGHIGTALLGRADGGGVIRLVGMGGLAFVLLGPKFTWWLLVAYSITARHATMSLLRTLRLAGRASWPSIAATGARLGATAEMLAKRRPKGGDAHFHPGADSESAKQMPAWLARQHAELQASERRAILLTPQEPDLEAQTFLGDGADNENVVALPAPAANPPEAMAAVERAPEPDPEGKTAEKDDKAKAEKSGRRVKKDLPVDDETALHGATGAGGWRLPSMDVLDSVPEGAINSVDNEVRARAIEQALASYNIDASVVEINPGPAVTQFGVEPGWVRKYKEVRLKDEDGKPLLDDQGKPMVERIEVSRTRVKVDAIANLDKDLAMAMAAPSIRIEAPIPGKSMVGVEVPNGKMEIVSLRTMLESPNFQKALSKSKLAITLGKGSGGQAEVADLTKMPHALIAGATGSGKSVAINTFLICILMNATPKEVRLLLIDPKRVELTPYNSVPHLVTPVIVEVDKVVSALRWAIHEMDERYKKFAKVGSRNLDAYNKNRLVNEPLPYLVIAIDELADLMMAAPYDVEYSITRLAQLGRATGIHLIVATQRPSVDVVTGLIKANFPTRMSFAVSSLVDSRTILDSAGAEKLLGKGDMLYLPQDAPKPKRIQGVFVSDREIERVVRAWNSQGDVAAPPRITLEEHESPVSIGDPLPPPSLPSAATAAAMAGPGSTATAASAAPLPGKMAQKPATESITQEGIPNRWVDDEDNDPLLDKARQLAGSNTRLSTSLLQRRLRIGYTKAKQIMEQLAAEGYIDSPQEVGSP